MVNKMTAALLLSVILAFSFSACTLQQQEDTSPSPMNLKSENRPQIRDVDYLDNLDQIKTKLNNHSQINIIDHNGKEKSHYIKGEVAVRFKKHPSQQTIDAIVDEIDGTHVKHHQNTCVFSSDSWETGRMLRYFNQRDDVIFAEPNYILIPNQAEDNRAVPNDSLYPYYQWNLPSIRTEDGWAVTKGSENVIVAVVDTGVDLNHPDLKDRLVEGYNVLNPDAPPQDDNGHGTHVAGIIAAQTNNQEGIAGMTWYNRIMPIKGIGAEGTGTSFDIAEGVRWAADHGADVINLSLGNYQPSQVLHSAVKYAFEKDIVIVAATGNDNTNQPGYPAAYSEVLAVAAVNPYESRAFFSNYGKYVDISAPGVDIASTYPDEQYAALSGTSMAAPHVSALAALIRSADPELTNKETMQIIRDSAKDFGSPGKDVYFGHGVIHVSDALQTIRIENADTGIGWLDRWLLRLRTLFQE